MAEHGSVGGRQSDVPDSSDLLYCTPCKTENLDVQAEGFCSSCREHLCHSCIAFHRKLGITKGHYIADISEAETSQPVQSSADNDETVKLLCEKHEDEVVKFYCRNHAVSGCGVCTTLEHRECQLDYIPEVAKNFKETSEFKTLIESIDTLGVNLQQFENNLKDKQTEVEEINDETEKLVKEMRTKMQSHLDDEVSKLLLKANTLKESNRLEITKARKCNLESREQLAALNSELKNWDNHPHKLFVVAKAIDEKSRIFQLNYNKQIESFSIEKYTYRPNFKMTSIISDLCPLGEIEPQVKYDTAPHIDLSSAQLTEVWYVRLKPF